MDADHDRALDAADDAYRRVSITQGLLYARDKQHRLTLVSAIIDAYMGSVTEALAEQEGPTDRDMADMLATALRHTQEYLGDDVLPRIEGWSWYDALVEYERYTHPMGLSRAEDEDPRAVSPEGQDRG